MEANLNYRRIIKLSIILFAALVIASTAVTLFFPDSHEQLGMRFWVAQYIVNCSVSLVAFILFARKAKTNHYKFAILIAAFYWMINITSSLLMSLALDEQTLNESIVFHLAITLIIVPLGTFLGLKLSKKNGS
jgi:hypothetical protein